MIERLRLRGLGVIDDASVDFGPGLTAITGETGAGKTFVLTGLGLLAGARADAGLVRRDAPAAWIDGEWRLSPGDEVVTRLTDAGAEVERLDGSALVLLGRTIAAEGRSRALAGGRTVPVGILQEVAERLLAVHGQADQMRLRSTEAQRELLDRFGGEPVLGLREKYAVAFADWRATDAELRSLVDGRSAREREAARLAAGIAEIGAVDPAPGEDLALDREAARLQHAGQLVTEVMAAHDALVGGDLGEVASAMQALAVARHALDRAVGVDPALVPLGERLAELVALTADLGVELAEYASDIDAEPEHQAWVEERRAALTTLRRRYGTTIDEVLGWLAEAERVVSEVADDDERVAELERRSAQARRAVGELGAQLTARRGEAAERFASAVTAELAELAMPEAALQARVTSRAEVSEWTSTGADTVELWLRPHAGGDFRPLAKSASGGELSRVMLAVEVVLAGADPVPTFVFDEIDAGIGGRAAVEVGRRLARLARSAQVIVVTHLPQVAAFADTHVVVTKDGEGLVTTSCVAAVDGPDRVRELVRMLSGLDVSEAGTAHAEELLAVADQERGAGRVGGASRAGRSRRRC